METHKISDVIILDYEIIMRKPEGGKTFFCRIDKFALAYGAKDEEAARKKGEFMVRAMIEFLNIENKQS